MKEAVQNLTEAVSLIDDRYLDLAEKTNEEILEMSKNKRSIVSVRRTMRMLLIAAVLVSLLTATAFAAGLFSVKTRPAERNETYTIHWEESEWMEEGSVTWKDLKYVFKFDGPEESRKVEFKPGWLPFEPREEMNAWSRTEDGWYTRLVSEGAPEVDAFSDNYQPYCVEVYYAPQFYNDGAMTLLYATPDEITEEDWEEYHVMKFHAENVIPANEYRDETHLNYYYVILFNQSNGEIIVVAGTSDMETVEHVAKELKIRQTDETVRSSDFENNAVFIDVGQG